MNYNLKRSLRKLREKDYDLYYNERELIILKYGIIVFSYQYYTQTIYCKDRYLTLNEDLKLIIDRYSRSREK